MKLFTVIAFVTFLSNTVFAQENLFKLRSEFLTPINSSESFQLQEGAAVGNKKSGFTAVLYSLLLPGMGELYADGFEQGQYSLIAEGGLWLTYLSFQQYGGWLQTDARNFAVAHAGALTDGKQDQFYVDLGNFNDTYDYNDKKLRDRDIQKVYDINGGYFWKWDSDQNRREYRAMRVSSEKVLNNSQFVIATIVVNRLISAINAARLTRQYNQRLNDNLGSWWLESSIINDGLKPDGLALRIVHRF
ncbi:MAG: hypothetical protein Q8L88_11355 [Bacteroidota bacterium]|nr:hypothetical protein [Bacteroidota bacterium]